MDFGKIFMRQGMLLGHFVCDRVQVVESFATHSRHFPSQVPPPPPPGSEETARPTIRDIQRQSTDVVYKIIINGKQTAVKDSSSKPDAKIIQCKFCGRKHQCKKELCPAYGKKCKNCGKSNHFAIKCTKREKKTYQVDDDTDSVESVDMVKSEQLVYTIKNTKIFADMMIRSATKQVFVQIDTGSSVNILPIKFMPKVRK